MSNMPSPREVIGMDPLGRLADTSKGRPWHFALGTLCFSLFYVVALPAAYGVLFPRAGLLRSSLTDYMNQMSFGLVLPAVVYFYVWQPVAIARVYGIAGDLDPTSHPVGIIEAIRSNHARKPWWLFALLFALSLVALGIAGNLPHMGQDWFNVNWAMLILLQLSRFLLFYLLIICALRHAVASFSLNGLYRQMRFPVMVAPTSYSLAFSLIANYTLSFASLGAVTGLYLGLRPLISPPPMPEYAIFVAVYFIVVPAGFFLPFWQAHRRMRSARDDRLFFLHQQLQAEYDQLFQTANKHAKAPISSGRISSLRELVALTEKAPVWPFEVLAVYRLIVTVILPFTLLGINYLIGILDLLN